MQTRRTFQDHGGPGSTPCSLKNGPLEYQLWQRKPAVIASGNGLEVTAKAMEPIQQGKDALDGVIAGVNMVSRPKDNSVGYGGLPNEEGVVELTPVMPAPKPRRLRGALRNISHPSRWHAW
jgi:N4-(beta-N-acetylglucosaminyl)-L-asparaginase